MRHRPNASGRCARRALCVRVLSLRAGVGRPARAATNNIFTVAGTLTMSGSTGDNGPATAAKLNSPNGVAATADGGYLIADTSNQVIRRVSPAGANTTLPGPPPKTRPAGARGAAAPGQTQLPPSRGGAPPRGLPLP